MALPLLATLGSLGLNFITDLISEHGEDLVVEGVKKVTGIDLNTKKELTPEELKILKEHEIKILELEFKKEELEFKKEELVYADINSARDLQKTSLNQDDIFSKRFQYYLASFWSIVGTLYLFLITFVEIPASNQRFADTVLGFLLGTGLVQILQYFFGSSKGSLDKHNQINDLVKEINKIKTEIK